MNIINAYITMYNFIELQKTILKITTSKKFNYKNKINKQQVEEIKMLNLINTFETLAILNAILKSTN